MHVPWGGTHVHDCQLQAWHTAQWWHRLHSKSQVPRRNCRRYCSRLAFVGRRSPLELQQLGLADKGQYPATGTSGESHVGFNAWACIQQNAGMDVPQKFWSLLLDGEEIAPTALLYTSDEEIEKLLQMTADPLPVAPGEWQGPPIDK